MSFTKSRNNPRPLGAVKKPLLVDSVPKFPPLVPKLSKSYEGILGNAMQVPPAKEISPERNERKSSIRSSGGKSSSFKSFGSGSANSSDNAERSKELKSALVS